MRIQSSASTLVYPFALIDGDGESRDRVLWLTGQEEEGHLLRVGINLVLLPFQRHQLELREN
jgi:hypothetical protein